MEDHQRFTWAPVAAAPGQDEELRRLGAQLLSPTGEPIRGNMVEEAPHQRRKDHGHWRWSVGIYRAGGSISPRTEPPSQRRRRRTLPMPRCPEWWLGPPPMTSRKPRSRPSLPPPASPKANGRYQTSRCPGGMRGSCAACNGMSAKAPRMPVAGLSGRATSPWRRRWRSICRDLVVRASRPTGAARAAAPVARAANPAC